MTKGKATFFVKASGVEGFQDYFFQYLEYHPNEALDAALKHLPAGWLGNIEITDEETSNPNEMPLIDYWVEK
jgi:hypothetical protein